MLFTLLTTDRIWQVREPRLDNVACGYFEIQENGSLSTITPVLPRESSVFERKEIFIELIGKFLSHKKIRRYTFMTSTCKSVPYLRHLTPDYVIFDQNDEEAVAHPELFIEMNEYADASA